MVTALSAMHRGLRQALAAIGVCAAMLGAAPALASETWLVGPKAPQMSLGEALAKARDGDTIALLEGEYDGHVGVVTQRQLTIRGVGKRPVLRAGGRHAEGKAILVVRDGDIVVENLEFRGARVPDGNGAGVRFERGRLVVRRCAFYDNENGLITANFPETELVIEDSEFGEAPRSVGSLPHLLYAGRIAKLTITGSRFHDGFEGHLIKSRARQNDIRYNLIFDGWGGEASYEIDLPNGGLATVVGNVIGQGPNAQNRALVAYGAEGSVWPGSALYFAHNTLVSGGTIPARFLRIFDQNLAADTPLFVINNVAAGLGFFDTLLPGQSRGNVRTLGRWLRGPNTLDYALANESRLRASAVDASNVNGLDLRPKAEFKVPVGTRPLQPPAQWAPGAMQ